MTDPLSIVASTASFISLGIQVTQALLDFYSAYKNRDSALAGIIERLEGLLETFTLLDQTLKARKFQSSDQNIINNINSSISNCRGLIEKLQKKCQKVKTSTSSPNSLEAVWNRLGYPFKKSTLAKIDENIDEIRDNLSVALQALQIKDSQLVQDDISKIRSLIELVQAQQISSVVRNWLKAPDATINHNAACAKRHAGTGKWLITSSEFEIWLAKEKSFLWLNGFAGCGKTVLCSTAIQHVFRRTSQQTGITFFYFTFSDDSKQDASSMLKALLLQRTSQLRSKEDLSSLYTSYSTGSPPLEALVTYFRYLVSRSTGNDEKIWTLKELHLLVTSRDESDIREALQPSAAEDISLKNNEVDQDIVTYISSRLNDDRKLHKWQPFHAQIQIALAERAKGVFRWVECQFQSLKSYPHSEDHLEQLLKSLPRSLDQTYERMLCEIEQRGFVNDARRILTMLCFAAAPLTVHDLFEGLATDIGETPGLNIRRRLRCVEDLREICPGLIEFDANARYGGAFKSPIVRIAHFSVQEYLESDRILLQRAAKFSLTADRGHIEMAHICLIYLLDNVLADTSALLTSAVTSISERYPFEDYAARQWVYHYRKSDLSVDCLAVRLLKDNLKFWLKLYNPEKETGFSYNFDFSNPDTIAAPVYYASFLGLTRVLTELLEIENRARGSSSVARIVNMKGATYGTALQAALFQGHKDIVQILIESGANVNVQAGVLGNALQIASRVGDLWAVKLLIKNGADIGAQGGQHGNVLQRAATNGHLHLVKLFLDRRVDVNARDWLHGNALQGASFGDHWLIAKLLLDHGADVNAQGGYYDSNLIAASLRDSERIVKLLLDHGADVNAQSRFYGSALHAAVSAGNDGIVKLLLDHGADVNVQDKHDRSVLKIALLRNNLAVSELLLAKGADVNVIDQRWWNTQRTEDHEFVDLLQRYGANWIEN